MNGTLQHFACPVCGRIRPLAKDAAQRIAAGRSSGTCKPGVGCGVTLDEQERHRRFWLLSFGVDEADIWRAGGALEWVAQNEPPDELVAVATVMPASTEMSERLRQHRAMTAAQVARRAAR